MFCIEPGGDPSLVLPFSPPAANWGPVELNANYNRPAALQNWLSMPGSSILGLMVLKVFVEQVGWGPRLVMCVNVLRFVDIV